MSPDIFLMGNATIIHLRKFNEMALKIGFKDKMPHLKYIDDSILKTSSSAFFGILIIIKVQNIWIKCFVF